MTSSLVKKEQALKTEKEKVSAVAQEEQKTLADVQEKIEVSHDVQETEGNPKEIVKANEEKTDENRTSASAAYRVAASAASYLHSRTTSLLTFKSSKAEVSEGLSERGRGSIGYVDMMNNVDVINGDMASFIVTTDSVTSVVTTKEEVKQAVDNDLNSTSSSPCEWFICDDDQTATRFFVIQVRPKVYSFI